MKTTGFHAPFFILPGNQPNLDSPGPFSFSEGSRIISPDPLVRLLPEEPGVLFFPRPHEKKRW